MKKAILIQIILVVISLKSYGKWDYSSTNVVRSYPIGFYSDAVLGKGLKLWGKKKSKKDALYGFIRPSLTYQTSVLVNSARGQIDIYPISFLGFYAGKDYTSRQVNIATFDCDSVVCKGNLERGYYGARMAVAAGPLVLMSDNKVERVEMKDKIGTFVDERATLLARSRYDYVTKHQLILGVKFSEQILFGTLFIKHYMKYYKNSSLMSHLFTQYSRKRWSYMVAVGKFQTRLDHDVFSVAAVIKWNGQPGLLLF